MDNDVKILLSAVAAKAIPSSLAASVISGIPRHSQGLDLQGFARSFQSPQLIRQLRLSDTTELSDLLPLTINGLSVSYGTEPLGQLRILYKSPLPGELQARLAIESAIDRFLEYLLKKYQIVVLSESDRHVQVFIPGEEVRDFNGLWKNFLKEVAFSDYGDSLLQMPGLVQTFIVMLNAVTLSGRGFSTLDIPILTRPQANVLAAWYLAVIQAVEDRQTDRKRKMKTLQREIELLQNDLSTSNLTDKERKAKEKEQQSKEKDLTAKEEMHAKEEKKYSEAFEKSFAGNINDQIKLWAELRQLETQLSSDSLPKKEQSKLQKQRDKLASKIVFSEDWLIEKRSLLQEIGNDPFEFVKEDCKRHPEKFKKISDIAKRFGDKATDQINSTRGDIFTQCITEMYHLLDLEDQALDPLPPPLLSDTPPVLNTRLAGDDSKEFCYACGVDLDPKTAKWQVLRFMFERPSQRRQSSSGEGRPHICASCSALAFASPLKVTDESIILRLSPAHEETSASIKIKDYVRMLTSKEVHLSAGKYIVLASDRTNKGDLAASKLGQVQYALAKVASIFPQEVLADFRFELLFQGNKPLTLSNRYLLFIRGLMENYRQSIIESGQEINMDLGTAIRYIQKELPYLAEYSLVKKSPEPSAIQRIGLEENRLLYWKQLNIKLKKEGEFVSSINRNSLRRAQLYEDVAALTGILYPFVVYAEYLIEKHLENSSKKLSPEDRKKAVAREVIKIIENVGDADHFCYYAAIGNEDRTTIRAKLKRRRDTHFIYDRAKQLLREKLGIDDLEEKREDQETYISLEVDDIKKAYAYFANHESYRDEKSWKDFTYHVMLSLYTRFPELVRKLKTTKD